MSEPGVGVGDVPGPAVCGRAGCPFNQAPEHIF